MTKSSIAAGAITSALIGLSPMLTQAAPMQFQQASATGEKIAQIAQNTSQNLPYLSPGSQGQAVLVLQIALKQLGYYSGLLDGVYERDFLLFNAVKKFQSSNGINADGVVGPGTWRAILSNWSNR